MERTYTEIYEYCIRCGACVRKCPVNAISLKHGKEHPPCAAFQNVCGEKLAPRYGCRKCQVGVPCEFRNPSK